MKCECSITGQTLTYLYSFSRFFSRILAEESTRYSFAIELYNLVVQ